MSNKITASIRFSFKGQSHEPSLELELDEFMRKSGNLPDIYMLLARVNNFDPYSYEFEMMQVETIHFSQAEGLVAEYVSDGVLDVVAFQEAWKDAKVLGKIQAIAKQYLSIENLNTQPEIKQALMKAYRLGNTD